MKKVILIEKGGDINEKNIKQFNKNELFKKCKFKSDKNFESRHTWKHDDGFISIFAKDSGNSNTINKLDLPPPLDNDLFYGKILACYHNEKELTNDNIKNLSKDEWEKFYNKQFGGFESLGEDSECSADEDDEEYDSDLIDEDTGYLKNSFVAGDNEQIEKEEEEEEEDEYDFSDTDSNDGEDSELEEEVYNYSKN